MKNIKPVFATWKKKVSIRRVKKRWLREKTIFLSVFLLLFLLFTSGPLHADRSHTGDLIIDGNEVFTIENEKFTQTGNIYVRDNGSLIIRNATLLMNISYHGEFIIGVYNNSNFEMSDSKMEVSIPGDCIDIEISGGAPTINIQNSDLSTGETILMFGNYTGKAVIKNTNVYMFMFRFTSEGDWDVSFTGGSARNITFRFDENYKGSFSDLKPGYFESWKMESGGQTLRIDKATAEAFTLACDGPSDVTMTNSEIGQFAICAPLSSIKLKSISSKIEQVCLHGIRDVKVKMWGLRTGYIDSFKLSEHSSGDPLPDVVLIDSTIARPWLVSGFGSEITINDSEIDLRSYVENNTLTAINCYISDLMLYCTTNSILNFEDTTIKYFTVLVPPNSVEISGGITFTPDSELTCWRSPTQIKRFYPIHFTYKSGMGVPGGNLYAYDSSNNLTWSGTTDENGTANLEIEFNDNNYLDSWTLQLSYQNENYTSEVNLLTSTPIKFEKSVTSTIPPFGSFDTPVNGSTVYSNVPVTGWVLDDIGTDSVKIYRENGQSLVYIGDSVFVEGARPDIEQAYPTYPMNSKAGWGYMMLTNFLPNGGNGQFTFHAIAADYDGNQITLGTKTITVDNANAVKPFGTIDTPAQGGTASGSGFINWGWVLTPQPNCIPTEGSTINVYVDGVNLGHPTYNIYRSDIASLFPNYCNSNGAAGYFSLDTTAYENGVHTIQWTAVDNAGNIDGIGSRYFSVENPPGSSVNRAMSSAYAKKKIKYNTGPFSKIFADSSESVRIKIGYNEDENPYTINPDNNGTVSIQIKALERVEIHLGHRPSLYIGYLKVGNQLRKLPIGSTFDTQRGVFYWLPGPGFIGEYEFIFIQKQYFQSIKKKITINIVPRSQ